jgi:hypothetical protein
LIPQDREQHFVLEIGLERFPIDVEVRRVDRAGPVFEHVHPPMVERLADAHVVRDEIDDLPHAVGVEVGDPSIVFGARTNSGIQLVVIGNVVAVQTLRARLEIRRRVTVADPERVEIRHDLARVGESELPVELQPVSRTRNPRVLLRAHEGGGNLDRIYRMDRIQSC